MMKNIGQREAAVNHAESAKRLKEKFKIKLLLLKS